MKNTFYLGHKSQRTVGSHAVAIYFYSAILRHRYQPFTVQKAVGVGLARQRNT